MNRLSILICHKNDDEERVKSLSELLAALGKQAAGLPVDVIVNADAGEMSVGKKRNALLDSAMGEYIAFVDDDDMVSETYVQDILTATAEGQDCTNLHGMMYRMDDVVVQNLGTFKHSIMYSGWYTGSDGVYYRTPNHLNPIKRSIANAVRFLDVRFAEDKGYSMRIKGLLKTEGKIDRPMYYYKIRQGELDL